MSARTSSIALSWSGVSSYGNDASSSRCQTVSALNAWPAARARGVRAQQVLGHVPWPSSRAPWSSATAPSRAGVGPASRRRPWRSVTPATNVCARARTACPCPRTTAPRQSVSCPPSVSRFMPPARRRRGPRGRRSRWLELRQLRHRHAARAPQPAPAAPVVRENLVVGEHRRPALNGSVKPADTSPHAERAVLVAEHLPQPVALAWFCRTAASGVMPFAVSSAVVLELFHRALQRLGGEHGTNSVFAQRDVPPASTIVAIQSAPDARRAAVHALAGRNNPFGRRAAG